MGHLNCIRAIKTALQNTLNLQQKIVVSVATDHITGHYFIVYLLILILALFPVLSIEFT